eukprot:1161624-Pelagomonas_calceolata.AAC.11
MASTFGLAFRRLALRRLIARDQRHWGLAIPTTERSSVPVLVLGDGLKGGSACPGFLRAQIGWCGMRACRHVTFEHLTQMA